MRPSLLLGSASVALAGVVACASSRDQEAAPPPDSDDGGVSISDAPSVDAPADAAAGGKECSPAGWCATPLPDQDLTMKDIWPYESRAFAVAESPTLGVKVLEWDDAAAKWNYIDDSTQNESGLGQYVGKIWSSSEDEIYYAVAPGTIYHGSRSEASRTWSWTRRRLEDRSHDEAPYYPNGNPYYEAIGNNYPALGVWGTSREDVYAWYANAIYRRTIDGNGEPAWAVEYVADDAEGNEQLFFVAATGRRGEVWFSGARNGDGRACALMVRKSPAGYQRVADGVLLDTETGTCSEKAGFLRIGGADGWLTDIQSPVADRLVGLKGATDVIRISADAAGGYSVAFSPRPAVVSGSLTSSLWSLSEHEVWLSGFGSILRGTDVWGDGGVYQISSIGLNGAPIRKQLYQVRGTSNANLWAVGAGYALHKTTP